MKYHRESYMTGWQSMKKYFPSPENKDIGENIIEAKRLPNGPALDGNDEMKTIKRNLIIEYAVPIAFINNSYASRRLQLQ